MLGVMAAAATVVSGSRSEKADAADSASVQPHLDILFVLYPRFTLQDFAGTNEILARLPDVTVRIASPDGGAITSDTRVKLADTLKLAEVSSCDLICVTGGSDHSRMMRPDAQEDLRRLSASAKYITSVCNGSLILGAAGILKGVRSACYWAQRDILTQYGAIPDPARVVRDGRFISGGGVTAGLDFALTVAAELRGPLQAQVLQLLIEYAPDPPFHAGRPEIAPPDVLAAFQVRYPHIGGTPGAQ
jgi:transcriptional regulator GlxA family with amidase domain